MKSLNNEILESLKLASENIMNPPAQLARAMQRLYEVEEQEAELAAERKLLKAQIPLLLQGVSESSSACKSVFDKILAVNEPEVGPRPAKGYENLEDLKAALPED